MRTKKIPVNKVSGLLKLLRPTSVERRHEPSKHLRSELIYNLRMYVPIEAVVPTGSDSCIGEGQFHDQLEVVLDGVVLVSVQCAKP